MTAAEMRALKLHFQLIGTTWTEWEDRQRGQNEPIKDVYPNRRAPVALLQDGQLVFMMERRQIEGQSADLIARQLMAAFDQYCAPANDRA